MTKRVTTQPPHPTRIDKTELNCCTWPVIAETLPISVRAPVDEDVGVIVGNIFGQWGCGAGLEGKEEKGQKE